MAILIGVDEAGYGPRLGPLVVAATAWRVAEERSEVGDRRSGRRGLGSDVQRGARAVAAARPMAPAEVDLYRVLKRAVVREPAACAARLAIADSKALYKSGSSLRLLERGVLAAVGVVQGSGTASVAELLATTRGDVHNLRRLCPCHAEDVSRLPTSTEPDDVDAAAALLDRTCRQQGVQLLAVRTRLVFPAEFNALVHVLGNKATALSHTTLELVRQLVDELAADAEAERTIISLDKHGGRNQYGALLQHHFPEGWVRPIVESRAASRYEWDHAGAPVEAVFRVACEELLPTALASMAAKYHRELAMRSFNAFWAGRIPNLRPTAGYGADANRFRSAIGGFLGKHGIEESAMWRNR